MNPRAVLESYAAMMGLGLVSGLLVGGFPVLTKEISMASLALLMAFSLSTVRLGEARGPAHVKHAAWSLVLNYGILSAVIIGIGLASSEDLWPGWVLMAAAPSAISIVPFTKVLGGQTTKALFSTAVNYLIALALMPVMTLALIGSAVRTDELIISLLVLIVLPMAGSRIITRVHISRSANAILINLCFAVMIFAVAGKNREAFAGDLGIVLAVCGAGALRTFGTGLATERVLRRLRMPKGERVSYVLFSSYKNLGLTATLAIALFEPIVAVPATICIVFEVAWVVFLVRWYPTVPD